MPVLPLAISFYLLKLINEKNIRFFFFLLTILFPKETRCHNNNTRERCTNQCRDLVNSFPEATFTCNKRKHSILQNRFLCFDLRRKRTNFFPSVDQRPCIRPWSNESKNFLFLVLVLDIVEFFEFLFSRQITLSPINNQRGDKLSESSRYQGRKWNPRILLRSTTENCFRTLSN